MRRLLALALALLPGPVAAGGGADTGPAGLTAVAGIQVGHHTLADRPTGCTVILAEKGATGGVDVRGGAPGTRETDLLDPVNSVEQVHAVVLSGGSAFGLDAASGVVRHLEERGVGFAVGTVRVPIVVGAILFDLGVGGGPPVRPGADCGYRAAAAATSGPIAEGDVGAGAGATVGKLAGLGRAMKAGVGTAATTLPDGVVVAALMVVNALGDVIDPATGAVVAGVRTADGSGLADARELVRSAPPEPARPAANTVIGVVATNASLTKAEATRVARMAQDGLARAISPAHTPWDGDTIFVLATGEHGAGGDLLRIGALAADMVAESILRAARQSSGLPGLPAAAQLGGRGE